MIRAWSGFAALGAGLIHLALAIGSPVTAAVALGIAGAVEFVWGVLAVAGPRAPLPRVARIAVLVPVGAWIATLLTGLAPGLGVRILPMLVASLLDIVVSVVLSLLLRRPDRRPLTARRYLVGVAAGAIVVIALTAPALAATEAGELAGTPPLPLGPHGH